MRTSKVLTLALVSLLSLALLGLVGCAGSSGSGGQGGTASADDSKLLEGKVWKATKIAGVTNVLTTKGAEATAEFKAGTMSGSGSVNRFNTSYTTASGNQIQIGQLASTMMAGPPEAMAQEKAYFAALPQAKTYKVTESSLTLLDAQGTVLVEYAVVQPTSLTGTEWNAIAYNNGKDALVSLVAKSTITATFGTDGTLSGNASVNQYSGKYTTSGDSSMTIDPAITSTKMAGPEELMTQEAAYLSALPKTAVYTIEGDELWLRDAQGAAIAHYVAK